MSYIWKPLFRYPGEYDRMGELCIIGAHKTKGGLFHISYTLCIPNTGARAIIWICLLVKSTALVSRRCYDITFPTRYARKKLRICKKKNKEDIMTYLA